MSGFAYATAPDLNIVFFAETNMGDFVEQAAAICDEADLVVALGNVDLDALAALLAPKKPALCVLGAQDPEHSPPAPFRALHGGGVTFKEWRVAGLSGGWRSGPGAGFYIEEEEARAYLNAMPSCDLLLSHTPPAGLPTRGRHFNPGFVALAEYITEHEPIYAFYACADDEHANDMVGETWVVGVSGILYPDPLRFV